MPLLFYGIFMFLAGAAAYLAGVFMAVPRNLFGLNDQLLKFNEWLVWYSGIPILLACVLAAVDFFIQIGRAHV